MNEAYLDRVGILDIGETFDFQTLLVLSLIKKKKKNVPLFKSPKRSQ